MACSELYTVLLTLHILFVIAWLGAGFVTTVISLQARADPAWGRLLAPVAGKYFPITSGLTGLLGILLWIDGPYDFGELWILLAAAGWIISSGIGSRVLGPNVEKWAETGDQAYFDRYMKLAPVDLVLLTLIVIDMVMKPGL